jgi:Lipid A 3-O-deacylase (PagL)
VTARPSISEAEFLRTALTLSLICVSALVAFESRGARAYGSLAPCAHCDVLVGLGTTFDTTFNFFAWTDGVVVPVTLELDDSRWELGAFRMTNSQRFARGPVPRYATNPYWGFTAMRRWQVLHRSRDRLYLGFGANYRSEVDYLETTHWNFAYMVAARIDLDSRGRVLELSIRHWSNAWIRQPNRGQNFVTLSFGF